MSRFLPRESGQFGGFWRRAAQQVVHQRRKADRGEQGLAVAKLGDVRSSAVEPCAVQQTLGGLWGRLVQLGGNDCLVIGSARPLQEAHLRTLLAFATVLTRLPGCSTQVSNIGDLEVRCNENNDQVTHLVS